MPNPVNFYNVLEAALAGNCVCRPVVLRIGANGETLAFTLVYIRFDQQEPFWVVKRFRDQGTSALRLDDWRADQVSSPDDLAIVQSLLHLKEKISNLSYRNFPFTLEEKAEIEAHYRLYTFAYSAAYAPGEVEANRHLCDMLREANYAGDYGVRQNFIIARRLAMEEFEAYQAAEKN